MDDRIRLAEAMGWRNIDTALREGIKTPRGFLQYERGWLPDPFTDANDDYAVLEWVRTITGRYEPDRQEIPKINWKIFCKQLCSRGNYEKGDYARAALKVIQNG